MPFSGAFTRFNECATMNASNPAGVAAVTVKDKARKTIRSVCKDNRCDMLIDDDTEPGDSACILDHMYVNHDSNGEHIIDDWPDAV